MSEVNQAFLRAYLKNRANETSPTPPASASVDTRGPQNPIAARPSAAAPRPPMGPSTHPSQSLPSGMNLRFDPAHGTQQAPSPVPQVAAIPFATPPGVPFGQEPLAPRQGVWSPVGAERGMKALERQSSPAVVRNGVAAISPEATQVRRPTASAPATSSYAPATSQRAAPVAPLSAIASSGPSSQAVSHPAPNVRSNAGPIAASYDQVMFVDGLSPHTQRVPATRPSERTLAEIAEPIAFGTGVPTSSPTTQREQPSPTHANRTLPFEMHARSIESAPARAIDPMPTISPPLAREFTPVAPREYPEVSQAPTVTQAPTVNRRFDASHQRQIERVATPAVLNAPAPAPAPTIKSPAIKSPAIQAPLPLPVAFSPSWEVDQFFWPEVVMQIEVSHADAFQQIGKHLSLANRDGLKVMMITSGERGVGRSTVAMHMARCAAGAGLRVALVDGDTFCPSLIDQLRLDMQQGWQDCLFENVPLHDIAIHSIADNITLFPLTSTISQQQVHANLHRMVKLIRRISNAFDMVFIDGSRLNLEQRNLVGVGQENVVDAAIVVTDTELSIKEKVDTAVSLLQSMGISSIGLVENFQS